MWKLHGLIVWFDKLSSHDCFIVISQRNVFHPCVWILWRALLHWVFPFPGSSGRLFPVLWTSRFNGFEGPQWFWKHPPNTEAARFVQRRLLWLTDGLIEDTETITETWRVGANFPSASTQRAGCRTQACWATMGSWGKLKFSAGKERGESFKGLVRISLSSQHDIFLIRALAVSTHLLLPLCMVGSLFKSTSKAEICKASNSQDKQWESYSRHADTSCHLSINGAFRIHVWHILGNLLFIFSDQMCLKCR